MSTSSRLSLLALEPRFVFDGALVYTFDDAAQAEAQREAELAAQRQAEENRDQPLALSEADLSAPAALREVVFVDGSIANLDGLLSALRADVERVVIRPGEDGLDQVLAHLANSQPYDALHIFGHGSAGVQLLGSTVLNADTVSGALAQQLQALGEYLTADADLLLYGCDVAQGEGGATLIRELARLTGADVAASTNVTGRAGDWVLEAREGVVDTTALVASDWDGQLETTPEPGPAFYLVGDAFNEASAWGTFVLHNTEPNQYIGLFVEDVKTENLRTAEIRYSLDNGQTWIKYTRAFLANKTDGLGIQIAVSLLPEQNETGNPYEGEESYILKAQAIPGNPGYVNETEEFLISFEQPKTYFSLLEDIDGEPVNVFNFSGVTSATKNHEWKDADGNLIGTFERFGAVVTDSWLTVPKLPDETGYTKNFVRSSNSASTVLTLAPDTAANYFGFYWAAGDPDNLLEFYYQGNLVSSFRSNIFSDLPAEYKGRHTNDGFVQASTGGHSSGFINFMTKDGVLIDKVVARGLNFESDNWTIGTVKFEKVGATSTILDNGTGNVVLIDSKGNPVINPATGTFVFDDTVEPINHSPLNVNSIRVNEASDYAVFTVKAAPNDTIQLNLIETKPDQPVAGFANIAETQQLEIWNGTAWVLYTQGDDYTVPSGGTLLVRVDIQAEQDNVFEGPETFVLKVSTSTGSTEGTCTILDDGTGNLYSKDNPVSFTPPVVTGLLDKDNQLKINNVTVNEASPFMVFTIDTNVGQGLLLNLMGGTAVLGVDTGSHLQYFVPGTGPGTGWVDYTPGATLSVPGTVPGEKTQLLVRLAVAQDDNYEISESLSLQVQLADNPSTSVTGVGTIVDDGSGTIFAMPADNSSTGVDATTGLPLIDDAAPKDDDRPITVTGTTVSDQSAGFVLFNVTGAAGLPVKLELLTPTAAPGVATVGTDTAAAGTLEYWNGTAWVTYNPEPNDGFVTIGTSGSMAVRIAVKPDSNAEGPESLTLKVTNTGGTAFTGVSYLVDDGGQVIGNEPPPRLSVTGQTVLENAGYLEFTVSGQAGQQLSLSLQTTGTGVGHADLSLDMSKFECVFDPLILNVLSNDTASAGTTLDLSSVRLFSAATGGAGSKSLDVTGQGTYTVNNNGTVTFTPVAGVSGSAELTPIWYSVLNTQGDESPRAQIVIGPSAVSSAPAQTPATLSLINGDFEQNSVANGTSTTTAPTGWTRVATSGNVLLTDPDVPSISFDFPAEMGVENNIIYLAGGTGYFEQTLGGGTMVVGQTITVYFDLGWPSGLNTQGGAYVRFFRDNGDGTTTQLATVNPYSLQPTGASAGNFYKDLSFSYTPQVADAGKPIIVRFGSGSGSYVAYDNVRVSSPPFTANDGEALSGRCFVMEYYNGSEWVTYDPSQSPLTLAGTVGEPSDLKVRVKVNNDTTVEGTETLKLVATTSTGLSAEGIGTIQDNDAGPLPPKINDVVVNEASPYAVFTVQGVPGAGMTLALQNDSDPDTPDALLGVDTGLALEFFDFGTHSWVTYDPANPNALVQGNGELLVRVAIVQDNRFEAVGGVGENFQLAVTYNNKGVTAGLTVGATTTGNATIMDDGTGVLFLTGTDVDPATPGVQPNLGVADGGVPQVDYLSEPDDDRTLFINDVTVNEASPYIVFEVAGKPGHEFTLDLASGTATVGTDVGTDVGNALEYWDGTSWVPYTSTLTMPSASDPSQPLGKILVRVAVNQDGDFERSESFELQATSVTKPGNVSTGVGSIVDDGTGPIWTFTDENGIGALDADPDTRDDDRQKNPVFLNDLRVNEGSPYAVLSIVGVAGAPVLLSVADGTAAGELGAATSEGGDYLTAADSLQVYVNGAWANYNPASPPTLSATNGTLLLRVALGNQEAYEGPERLAVTVKYPEPNDTQLDFYPGGTFTGHVIIVDDGTGTKWAFTGNTDPGTPTTATEPAAGFDDDRPLDVKDVEVNEGSPFVVFTVEGREGQYVKLELGTTGTGSGHAVLGTDTGAATELEYWNGSAWVSYTPGTYVQIPGDGDATAMEAANLLVRVAIKADTLDDNGETFKLTASNTGGTSDVGTATIKDDGSGLIFATDVGASGVTPATAGTPATPVLLTPANGPVADPTKSVNPDLLADDDRPLDVKDLTVNEGSPFAVFTVEGKEGQYVKLELGSTGSTPGTHAELGVDTGTTLEYWDGTNWLVYVPGTFVQIPGDTDLTEIKTANLLVRVAITPDMESDNGETFKLTATNTGGTSNEGTATIMDDGSGMVFKTTAGPEGLGVVLDLGTGRLVPETLTVATGPVADPATDNLTDDDRPLTVDDVVVNEGSPYAVFTVGGKAGQYVELALFGESATPDTPDTPDTDFVDALEYWDGDEWVPYTPGTFVQIPGDTAGDAKLLVRVAILQDDEPDSDETFVLMASNTGGHQTTGMGTIKDDGTGTLWTMDPEDPTDLGTFNTVTQPALGFDDDRPLQVVGTDVNEASPYVLWTVTGAPDQLVLLSLGAEGDAAEPGEDTGTDAHLQVLVDGIWVVYDPVKPPRMGADGKLLVRVNVIQDDDQEFKEALSLVASNTGGSDFSGVSTISDDGTGLLFGERNTTGVPDDVRNPANVTADPSLPLILDNDRKLVINDVSVNEGSPFVVFTVEAKAGDELVLALASGNATIGQDTGTQLQYFVPGTGPGTGWVDYDDKALVPAGDQLLVRVAITQDAHFEGPESFYLQATFTDTPKTVSGKATIFDDGSSNVFGALNTSGTPDVLASSTDPSLSDLKQKGLDDDRPLEVTGTTVGEASGQVYWSVRGEPGQVVSLSVASGTALLGVDTAAGTALQVFNGTAWVAYSASVTLPASGELHVRLAVNADSEAELAETLVLTAQNASGTGFEGTSTIVDEGPVIPNGEKPLAVVGQTVNEASPFLVFTVSGEAGQTAKLELVSGTATVGTDTGSLLQVLVGDQWVDYDADSLPEIPDGRELLVRVAVTNDGPFEGEETLVLKATTADGLTSTGVGAIVDDGTGAIFLGNNNTATPNVPGNTDPNGPDYPAQLNDDRLSLNQPPAVNSFTVNEGSPYAVFTVTGVPGAGMTLTLAAGTATAGDDYVNAMEVFDEVTNDWVAYDPEKAQVGAQGTLLVRVALNNDAPFEGPETFQLKAKYNTNGPVDPTNTSEATGTATIIDDGTGLIFLATPATLAAPATPEEALKNIPNNEGVNDLGVPELDKLSPKNDDRALSVNSIKVNEGSPYAVFTVTAVEGQQLLLDLASGKATVGQDTGTQLQYFVPGTGAGTGWVNYTPGTPITVLSGGTDAANEAVALLVRVAITQDAHFEGPESFTLQATYASNGKTALGTGTIFDDGTGDIFATRADDPNVTGDQSVVGVNADGTPVKLEIATTSIADPAKAVDPDLLADDDRPLNVKNVEVNEASPYIIWTVEGKSGQYVQLDVSETGVGDGHATLGVDVDTQLQVLITVNGVEAWTVYVPGMFVRMPLTTAGADAQLLVRLAVKNDFLFEDRETLRLTATNTAGVSANGEGAIRDDGQGLLFGSANTTGIPDAPSALGLQVLDDDRLAPPIPQPVEAPPARLDTPLQPTAPALHVQAAVNEGRQATGSVGSPSMLANIVGKSSGSLGRDINTQKSLDALYDKFDRVTDPNLYVLPEVKDTRSQAFDVKVPAIELQSGILFEPSESAGNLPGIFVVSQADGQTSVTAMADAELERATTAVAAQALPWWQAEALEAEALEALREQHLAAAQAALGANRALDAAPQAAPKGQLGFAAKLKASARQPVRA